MIIEIKRTSEEPTQTLGKLKLIKNGSVIFTCRTLELPWKDNQRNISRIPEGIFKAQLHTSPKFGRCIWLNDDKLLPRTEILIHKGNFYKDTKGCILVGRRFTDINHDGFRDVTSSASTLDDLLDSIPQEEDIEVVIENFFLTNKETFTYRALWNSFLSSFKTFFQTFQKHPASGKLLPI
jgi:hypothetical protein